MRRGKQFFAPTYVLSVAAVGLMVGFGVQFARAWVNPTATPPGGNLAGPLTTGNVSQTKAGGDIGLGGGGSLDAGGHVAAPVLCIGADCRNAWPVPTGGGTGDNLGNHTATRNLNMSTYSISNANSITANAVSVANQICLAGSCISTWPAGGGAGDNLGNHIATMRLDMAGFNINMRGSGTVNGNINNAGIVTATQYCIGTSCITAWPAGGGAGDNLGNHTATTNLNMSGRWILSTGQWIVFGPTAGANNGIYSDGASGNMAMLLSGTMYFYGLNWAGYKNVVANDFYINARGAWASEGWILGGNYAVCTPSIGCPGGPNQCFFANPFTGACSCPAGYSGRLTGFATQYKTGDTNYVMCVK